MRERVRIKRTQDTAPPRAASVVPQERRPRAPFVSESPLRHIQGPHRQSAGRRTIPPQRHARPAQGTKHLSRTAPWGHLSKNTQSGPHPWAHPKSRVRGADHSLNRATDPSRALNPRRMALPHLRGQNGTDGVIRRSFLLKGDGGASGSQSPAEHRADSRGCDEDRSFGGRTRQVPGAKTARHSKFRGDGASQSAHCRKFYALCRPIPNSSERPLNLTGSKLGVGGRGKLHFSAQPKNAFKINAINHNCLSMKRKTAR